VVPLVVTFVIVIVVTILLCLRVNCEIRNHGFRQASQEQKLLQEVPSQVQEEEGR